MRNSIGFKFSKRLEIGIVMAGLLVAFTMGCAHKQPAATPNNLEELNRTQAATIAQLRAEVDQMKQQAENHDTTMRSVSK